MVHLTLTSEFTTSNVVTWLRMSTAAKILKVTQVYDMKMTTWTKRSVRYCPVVLLSGVS